MLHVIRGDYNAMTLPQLHDVPLVPPVHAGNRWQGVAHGRLVDGIIHVLKNRFGVLPLPGSEKYAVSPDGSAMIGGFSLAREVKNRVVPLNIPGIPQETIQAIGFRHGNNLRQALNIHTGALVMLCTNGMVNASFSFRRKHTTGLALLEWLDTGLSGVMGHYDGLGDRLSKLFERTLRPQDHDRLLLQLAREHILPWRLLGELDAAWHLAQETSQPGWVEEERARDWGFEGSAWDWYNLVTHTAKLIPPAVQYKTLEDAFRLVAKLLPVKAQKELESAPPMVSA